MELSFVVVVVGRQSWGTSSSPSVVKLSSESKGESHLLIKKGIIETLVAHLDG